MINTFLSGQSSELFVDLRDRMGLCYAAQPIHFLALEAGYFGIYMATGHDKVTPALNAIRKIIDRIKTSGITEEEFKQTKMMIEGQNLLNIQTNEDYAAIYSVPILQGLGIDYFYNNNQEIKDLPYEKFQKTIAEIFSRSWNTVIVGRSEK